MATFDQLPDEVVDIIFATLTRTTLRTLMRVPVLGAQATRYLYSSVIIDPFVRYSRPTEVYRDNEVPVVISVREFVKIVRAYRVAPRRIMLEDPFDAFELAAALPGCLERVKLDISFEQCKELYENAIAKFTEEYRLKPFRLNSVSTKNCHFPVVVEEWRDKNSPDSHLFNGHYDYLWDLLEGVTAYTTSRISVENLTRLGSFLSLTSLTVDERIRVAELHCLPSQLQDLTCSLSIDFRNEVVALNFPNSIKSLMITSIAVSRLNGSRTIDISRLNNLHVFKFLNLNRTYVKWRLPPSLKIVGTDKLNLRGVKYPAGYPFLEELHIHSSVLGTFDDGDTNSLKALQSVRSLTVPSSLFRVARNCFNPGARINYGRLRHQLALSPALERLVIFADNQPGRKQMTAIDFKANYLAHLKELDIGCFGKLHIEGDIPESVTDVAIKRSTFVEFETFSFLPHLTRLSLCETPAKENDSFTTVLPQSLKWLSMTRCNFKRATILAPNLDTLILKENQFEQLDDTTLILPRGLTELDLSGNEIRNISLALPPHLRVLKLTDNVLTSIDTPLPVNLRTLDCRHNNLGQAQTPSTSCVFPQGLTILDLCANGIDSNWLSAAGLHRYTKLRHLDLSLNKLASFDPSLVPAHLVHLDVSLNRISYLAADFTRLKYLKTLNLGANHLGGYFEYANRDRRLVFGANIRTVDVRGMKLTESDAEALNRELFAKRKFERVDLDQDAERFTVDSTEYRPRKVRRLR
ncbi:Osteomodulin [Candida viswanathii]|uniref:Osteomodulin n=1 Tax=Candida viswanathii TaxID=5486 RepID=A0A367YIZ0_9ASCO|nr:Osteomodulin [Candida viswanathii]